MKATNAAINLFTVVAFTPACKRYSVFNDTHIFIHHKTGSKET